MHVSIFIALLDFILSTISYAYYHKNLRLAKTKYFAICYLLLAVNAAAARMLPEALPITILKISSWLSGFWIAFIYYSLWLALLHTLVWGFKKIFSLKRISTVKIAVIGLPLILCFLLYGSFKAFQPVVRTENLVTDKLTAGEKYKIVLVSDIHLGRILGKDYAENLVQQINAQQPDIILMAGDIVDEKLIFVATENSLEPFNKLQPSLGTYAAFGNHDYLDNGQLFQQLLTEHKIKVLQNENAVTGNLKITGLIDYSRNKGTQSLQDLSADNDRYYNIVIDHQPRRMEAASAAGYDLYVSGHTHTGQLFPNRFVTKKMYPLDYGIKEFGSLTAITSSGYGFWGPPIRTEMAPEIVVIKLQGK